MIEQSTGEALYFLPLSRPLFKASISGAVSTATSARSAVHVLLTIRSRNLVIVLALRIMSSSGGGRERKRVTRIAFAKPGLE